MPDMRQVTHALQVGQERLDVFTGGEWSTLVVQGWGGEALRHSQPRHAAGDARAAGGPWGAVGGGACGEGTW